MVHQAAHDRRAALLIQKDMRFVAEGDNSAAPGVRQQRCEIAHRAAGDKQRRFLAQ